MYYTWTDFLPAIAEALGTVCPYIDTIRNNQRMKLVKYFHNSFLLIFLKKNFSQDTFRLKNKVDVPGAS